jgi:ribosomal-protein-alanine N-acetyltransferase
VQPEELDANYIRRSDAEIFSAPRPELSAAIRAAALGDVPALLALEREMTTSAHWTREHYVQRVQAGLVMLAEKSGRLCGFLCAQVAGEWEIENLVVSALFRRQGVARRLVHALIQSARDRGASTLLLEVRESNLPARQLYEKQGFEVTGRRPMYYRDPPEDALLYALRISGL